MEEITTGEIKRLDLTVSRCARCGEDHQGVTAYRLDRPAIADGFIFEFYLTCPTNGQPVFVRIFER